MGYPNWSIQVPLDAYAKREMKGFCFEKPDLEECIEMIKAFKDSRITIIIDALDEVRVEKREEFFKYLKILIAGSTSSLNIFVSGSTKEDILQELEGTPCHYLQPNDNFSDMEAFIEGRIHSYERRKFLLRGKTSEKTKRKIMEFLKYRANGMFLWADLHIRELCKLRHESQMMDALRNPPTTLREMYRSINDNILDQPEQDYRVAITAIEWVMNSARPPSINELIGAIYWSQDVANDDDRDLWDFQDVLAICRYILVLDLQEEVVRFTHHSAKEYFEDQTPPTRRSAVMTKICLRSLTYPDVPGMSNELHVLADILRYSVEFWSKHMIRDYYRVEIEQGEQFGKLQQPIQNLERFPLQDFLQVLKLSRRNFQDQFSQLSPSGFRCLLDIPPSPLISAMICGLGQYIVEYCLPGIKQLRFLDHGEPTLPIATLSDYPNLTQSLPDNLDAHLDVQQKENLTPMDMDADGEVNKVVMMRIFLTTGAEIKTPLITAVTSGNLEMAKLLVNNGANINFIALRNRLPIALYAAIRYGRYEITKYLLDNGANVNQKLRGGTTVLHTAVLAGSFDLVKLLIDRGGDVNIKGKQHETVLQFAKLRGNSEISELAGHAGASHNEREDLRMALFAATCRGDLEILEYLHRIVDLEGILNRPRKTLEPVDTESSKTYNR